MTGLGVRRWIGFVAGMALTSASLSSGFIWACGSPCATWGLLWTPDLQLPLVFGAALAAWWGYLVAHYAVAGTFVDESTHGVDGDGRSEFDRSNPGGDATYHHLGVLAGVGVLVLGMVVGVVYIRQGNHLMTNVGGVLFLGGYALAHYVETGIPV